MSRPHVFTHTLTSVDGRLEGFPADVARYYELAARLPHDAVLAGSGTMVAAAAAADVDLAESGEQRVDLEQALRSLHEERGIERVRVDAGPGLNGALLRAGLLDEVSVLIAPYLVGERRSTLDRAHDDAAHRLVLTSCEPQPDGYVWLRYGDEHR